MTVRVVVVDDEAMIRAALATILGTHPQIEVVGQAGDGASGVELVQDLAPDVVLMDIQMPRLDGLAATRALVADRRCQTSVIVLTTFHREDYLMEALRAGACGFLLKTDQPEHLTAAVLAAAQGEGLLSPEVTRTVISRAISARPTPQLRAGALTERETEVLRLVAKGLSNEEIAATLVVSRATVKTHVSNLLMKLDVRDRVQAVVYAYEHGYVSDGSAQGSS